ncbi:hypothetical protein OSCI_330013 [Kamptonema sp. PCC 6506]|nr:hypothetical protein OSCI_330013 [Kamptonema sp. PCC 6506]
MYYPFGDDDALGDGEIAGLGEDLGEA